MGEPVVGPVVAPSWPYRIGRVVLGLRVPEANRAWVAVRLRVCDDLRFRAVRCATGFLCAAGLATLAIGPALARRVVVFEMIGAVLGLVIGLVLVARNPGRRDLPYRLAGVRRDGTVDPSPPTRWLPIANGASLVIVACLAAVLLLPGPGSRIRTVLAQARREGECRPVPARTRDRLLDAAVPGSTLVGLRQLHAHGTTYVAARAVLHPQIVVPGVVVDHSGTAAWTLLPDGFGPGADLPQGANDAAAAATPAGGRVSFGGPGSDRIRDDQAKVIACAEAATGPTSTAPGVEPATSTGRLVVHGPAEIDRAVPPTFCSASGARFVDPSTGTQIAVVPPLATVFMPHEAFTARGAITDGTVRISGPLHPLGGVIGTPTAPPLTVAGSIEAIVVCQSA